VAAFDHLVDQKICFSDSRNSQMGFRAYLNSKDLKGLASGDIGNEDQYNMKRINLKLPDDSDLSYDKSFPLEFGFDDLNAIDYKKGCYVGQETTARMHYKGIIRKKIFLVKILNCQKINKGLEIESEDKKIGEILSSVFYQNQLFALALIKNLDNEGQEIDLTNLKLTADGKELEIK
jgi:folate-binding protein YgfZ